MTLRRREFITLLGGAAAAWPLAARAQQRPVPLVGLLCGASEAEWASRIAGVRRGLAETAFFEGSNLAIEYRWADGLLERLPAMAAQLVDRKVKVIVGVAGGASAAVAATKSIPIVFTTAGDPISEGLVASLARPGGNATGITLLVSEIGPKRIELLHEMLPRITKVAFLANPPNNSEATNRAQAAAQRLGMETMVLNVVSESDIDNAFVQAVQQRASAVYVGGELFFINMGKHIAALGLRYALPTTLTEREQVAAGGLMSYGTNQVDMYRLAGTYVGRILRGAKPADLPVQQPTKFELTVNLKTARMLGLEIPPNVLALATEVIE
jgi:putative ABC transport system substrate-binding protein